MLALLCIHVYILCIIAALYVYDVICPYDDVQYVYILNVCYRVTSTKVKLLVYVNVLGYKVGF